MDCQSKAVASALRSNSSVPALAPPSLRAIGSPTLKARLTKVRLPLYKRAYAVIHEQQTYVFRSREFFVLTLSLFFNSLGWGEELLKKAEEEKGVNLIRWYYELYERRAKRKLDELPPFVVPPPRRSVSPMETEEHHAFRTPQDDADGPKQEALPTNSMDAQPTASSSAPTEN